MYPTEKEVAFFKFIVERHNIWCKRFIDELPKPWTKDQYFLTYKFTNVFRELDTGTLVLRRALNGIYDSRLLFHIFWYRVFNLAEHAQLIERYPNLQIHQFIEVLEEWISARKFQGYKIFTSAHMLRGIGGEPKHITTLKTIKWFMNKYLDENSEPIGELKEAIQTNTLEAVFNCLVKIPFIGKFLAYEIVCDYRFYPEIMTPTDQLTWGSVGPGAVRGLKRVGYLPTSVSMMELHQKFRAWLFSVDSYCDAIDILRVSITGLWRVPFEIREIEHSLCEFDKYERVRNGEGRPKERYEGRF